MQRPEQRTVELAVSALKSLWTFDPSKAHKESMELTKAKLTSLKQIGTIALARFSYELPLHERELAATIECLEELHESDDKNLLITIARAFGDLSTILPEGNQLQRVRDRLLRLASHEEPYIQFVVSKVLYKQAGDSGDTEWFWITLGHLSGVPACHWNILEMLDWTTDGMVEHHPERVARYLEDVVISRSYGAEGENGRLPKMYETYGQSTLLRSSSQYLNQQLRGGLPPRIFVSTLLLQTWWDVSLKMLVTSRTVRFGWILRS